MLCNLVGFVLFALDVCPFHATFGIKVKSQDQGSCSGVDLHILNNVCIGSTSLLTLRSLSLSFAASPLFSVCWPIFSKLTDLTHFSAPLTRWLSSLKHKEVASVVPVKDLSHLLIRFIMFFKSIFIGEEGGR
jgi:hypothetical protein